MAGLSEVIVGERLETALSEVMIHERLEALLPARARLRLERIRVHERGELREGLRAREDVAAEPALPAGVAPLDVIAERIVPDHLLGDEERARAEVDRLGVGDDEVL